MKIKSNSLIIGILLGVVIMFVVGAAGPSREGKYQLTGEGPEVYVLGTKTSELWLRTCYGPAGNIYLGTNEKPAFELIEVDN